eukprot:TRINITY_DN4230_c0_g1_i3.p1 TRINITY_DN4230_c0_g1~~TRINITY_DN4230_c0_g1_i3.p1  ORF type:complete len:107 (+),score=21.09 TRINITY_DN4230_c0_g1_i3:239-559(+)
MTRRSSRAHLTLAAILCIWTLEGSSEGNLVFSALIGIIKFVGVLNSKKAKLRELRDQLSKRGVKSPQDEDDESTDRTEIMGGSEDEISKKRASKESPQYVKEQSCS